MQRIGQLQAFVQLKEGDDATFVHPVGTQDQARLIKMRVLTERPVNIFVVPLEYDYDLEDVTEIYDDPDFTRFLTHIKPGLEQIEFYWKGSFAIRLMGGNVWLDTFDNTAFNIEMADTTSYARLWEREERDPRILQMEQIARANERRFNEQMDKDRAELTALRDEIRGMTEQTRVDTPPSTSGAPAGGVQTPSAGVPSAGDSQTHPAAQGANGGEPESQNGQS